MDKNGLKIGDMAPDFTLPSQTGKTVSLKDFRENKSVVIYFYPKDFTPGCTQESCSFRDNYEIFKDVGAEVIGISSDNIDSHQRFVSEHKLPFMLLSDEDGKVRKLYGASTLEFIPARMTFIIDKNGIIKHIFSSQRNPEKHIEEALRILKS